MAAEPSPCSSQLSTNQSPVAKQEKPQDASNEIMDTEKVKVEPILDSKEANSMKDPKDANSMVDSKEGISMVDSKEEEVKEEPEEEVEPIEQFRNVQNNLSPDYSPCFMDSKEHIEKFKRYEAEFKQYLMSKYFSDKTIFGGNIADVKMNIDGHTITASRLPPYQSYLDPANFDELISKEPSGTLGETPTTSTSNGKPAN